MWSDGLVLFAPRVADAGTPLYLVLDRPGEPGPLADALTALGAVGLDQVKGILASGFEGWRDAGMTVDRLGTTSAEEVRCTSPRVLDVRDDTEYESDGHIPEATHLFVRPSHGDRAGVDVRLHA